MKILLLSTFCLLYISTIAQYKRYNMVFDKNQTQLNNQQKQEFKQFTCKLIDGEVITIYPLVYDSSFEGLIFDQLAASQALHIAEYAQNTHFELVDVIKNFPSYHRRNKVSIAVRVKYNMPRYTVSGLRDHYPPKHSQYFLIDPKKDTIITAEEGTVLYFKAGCLQSEKTVEVELKEFYSMADYMKNGLPTTSYGKMIQTGGSMYLNAKEQSSGKRVGINPNKGVGVDFTLGKNDPKMEVFIADPTSRELNWVPSSKLMKKHIWEMTLYFEDAEGNVKSKRVFHSPDEYQGYLDSVKQVQDSIAQVQREIAVKDSLRNVSRKKMDGKLQVYNLGYINCDRFPDEPMMAYSVKPSPEYEAEYYLIFNEVRGVMKGSLSSNAIDFGSVPSNKEATLIAVTYLDDKPFFFKQNIVPGNPVKPNIQLTEVDDAYVDEQLAMLK